MSNEQNERMRMVAKTDAWFDGKKYVPFDKLSDNRLQNAKIHAQRKELYHNNLYTIFATLVDNLDKEASNRGIELEDYDSEFHKNERMLKNKIAENGKAAELRG